jgi:hypothetical protein
MDTSAAEASEPDIDGTLTLFAAAMLPDGREAVAAAWLWLGTAVTPERFVLVANELTPATLAPVMDAMLISTPEANVPDGAEALAMETCPCDIDGREPSEDGTDTSAPEAWVWLALATE